MDTEDGLARMAGIEEAQAAPDPANDPGPPGTIPGRSVLIAAYAVCLLYGFVLGFIAGWLVRR